MSTGVTFDWPPPRYDEMEIVPRKVTLRIVVTK